MSWIEKLKQYNVDEEKFNSFCSKYGEFATNRELMAKLYFAKELNMRVAEPKIVGEFKKVTELVVRELSRIKVVVVQKVEERSYVGCPKCLRKLEAAPNTTVECVRDGVVKAQMLTWNLVLAGDSSGEIMLTIPPSIGRVPNVGEVIAAEGSLSEQGEFFVYRYNVVPAEPIEVVAATQTVTVPPTSTPAIVPTVTATTVTVPTPAPAPTVTIAVPTEGKCPICGREFKSKQALGVHIKLAHKKVPAEAKPTEVKPVEAPKPAVETKPEVAEVKPEEVKPSLPDEAVKLTRVAATINKPVEDFKASILSKFPGINIDELFKAAGVIVEGGVMKRATV
jgi:hypothetical protein